MAARLLRSYLSLPRILPKSANELLNVAFKRIRSFHNDVFAKKFATKSPEKNNSNRVQEGEILSQNTVVIYSHGGKKCYNSGYLNGFMTVVKKRDTGITVGKKLLRSCFNPNIVESRRYTTCLTVAPKRLDNEQNRTEEMSSQVPAEALPETAVGEEEPHRSPTEPEVKLEPSNPTPNTCPKAAASEKPDDEEDDSKNGNPVSKETATQRHTSIVTFYPPIYTTVEQYMNPPRNQRMKLTQSCLSHAAKVGSMIKRDLLQVDNNVKYVQKTQKPDPLAGWKHPSDALFLSNSKSNPKVEEDDKTAVPDKKPPPSAAAMIGTCLTAKKKY